MYRDARAVNNHAQPPEILHMYNVIVAIYSLFNCDVYSAECRMHLPHTTHACQDFPASVMGQGRMAVLRGMCKFLILIPNPNPYPYPNLTI